MAATTHTATATAFKTITTVSHSDHLHQACERHHLYQACESTLSPLGRTQVWAGPLKGGARVCVLLHRSGSPDAMGGNITITWRTIGYSKDVQVRDGGVVCLFFAGGQTNQQGCSHRSATARLD